MVRSAVVGGGSAGSVVARRLADAGDVVVLFEAGPGASPGPALDWLPGLDAPGRLVPDLTVSRTSGAGLTPYRQGRGLGGGSAVNGMVLDEPSPSDPMWGPITREELSGARARVADRVAGWTPPAGPLGAALLGADLPEGWRARPARLAVEAGRRLDAAAAWGVREHPAIELRADQRVERLVPSSGGVEVVVAEDGIERGRPTEAFDRVVVCAGAIGSPLLLGASGVADRFVGLADHPSLPLTVELTEAARVPVGVDAPPATTLVDLTLADGSRSGDAPHRAHLYVMDHLGDEEGRRFGLAQLALLDARSSGSIVLGPDGRAEIRFDLLADAADRRALRAALRETVRTLDPSSPASPLHGVATASTTEDGTPAVFLADLDDAGLDRWMVHHLGAHAHAAASLGLGRHLGDDGAVPELPGVHVVDSSAFAALPAANPQQAVLVLAEALVERILAG